MSTISITYRDIPTWLHSGDFYRNLNADDPEELITIPAECIAARYHWTVEDGVSDFCALIKVTLFWMLDNIPVGVLEFCVRWDIYIWREAILSVQGAKESKMFDRLLAVQPREEKVPFDLILKTGQFDLILLAGRLMKESNRATEIAAEEGNLPALICLHEGGFAWDYKVYYWAARKGHLHIMLYAHDQRLDDWHVDVCSAAAQEGQLACLQFAHEHGCYWNFQTYVSAASQGHLDIMQYAHEKGLTKWHVEVCREASINGHFECLQYAHENGCPWDTYAIRGAAQHGYQDCLQYLLEQGCPIHKEACNVASKNGHLSCLQLLYQHDAPWSTVTSHCAAMRSDVSCLQYLHEQGCPWDEWCARGAAQMGHLAPLRYAIEQGCPYDDTLVQYAAMSGNIECLQYLFNAQRYRQLSMSTIVFMTALCKGNLICLQYLLDQGCPYIGATNWLEVAFVKDNPEFTMCVRYAVERGWNVDVAFCEYISSRDAVCTAYLKDEGLFVTQSTCNCVVC